MKKFICSLFLGAMVIVSASGCNNSKPPLQSSAVSSGGSSAVTSEISGSNSSVTFDLAAYKLEKISEVNAYFPTGLSEASYSQTNLSAIESFKSTAVTQIENASSKVEVDNIVTTLKANVGNVLTLAQENAALQTYKDSLIGQLQVYKNALQSSYSVSNWGVIGGLKVTYAALIQEKDTTANALLAYEAGINAIDLIPTLAQELVSARNDAKGAVDALIAQYPAADYDQDEIDLIQGVKTRLYGEIEAALTADAVGAIVAKLATTEKGILDAIPTKEMKIEALRQNYIGQLNDEIALVSDYFPAGAFTSLASAFALTLDGLNTDAAMSAEFDSAAAQILLIDLDPTLKMQFVEDVYLAMYELLLGIEELENDDPLKIAYDNEVVLLASAIADVNVKTIADIQAIMVDFTEVIFGVMEVAMFLSAYAEVLVKTVADVALSDTAMIKEAIGVYEDVDSVLSYYSQLDDEYANLQEMDALLDIVNGFIDTHETVFDYLDTAPVANLDAAVLAIAGVINDYDTATTLDTNAIRLLNDDIFALRLMHFRLKYRELLNTAEAVGDIADAKLALVDEAIGVAATLDPTSAYLGAEKSRLQAIKDDIEDRVYITFHVEDGGVHVPQTYTQKVYKDVPATLTENQFHITGFSFQGWTATQGNLVADYIDEDAITINTNLDLYAVWVPVTPEQILLDLDSGVMPDGLTYVEGNPGEQILDFIDTPTKSSTAYGSYSFDAWYIDSGFATELDETHLFGDPTITMLYAKWIFTATQSSVTINLNGGTGIGATVSGNYGDTIANPGTPTKATDAYGSYTFDAWYVDAGFVTALNSTHKYGIVTNLYANWILSPASASVTINLNGGSGIGATVSGNYGAVIANPGTPTKATDAYGSYAFAGWYTDATFTTPLDGTHLYGVVTNLYANWTLTPASASVTINLNGGSGIAASISGNYGAVIANPGTPTKATDAYGSYAFAGWYTDAAFATPLDGTHLYGIVTNLYAKWTLTPASASVTINLNGGSGIAASISGNYGAVIANPGTPTKTTDAYGSYAFAGWYIDAAFATPLDGTHQYGIVSDLYAKWTITPASASVTINLNGGSGIGSTVSGNYGAVIADPGTPTKADDANGSYAFAGWYIDSGFVTPLDGTHLYGFVTDLYANWTLTPASASVTINLNGGSGIGATVSGNYGAVIADPGTPTKATDAYGSYAFDGWYIDAAFVTPLDGTHTYGTVLNLYAKWTLTPASATVTLNLNGGSGVSLIDSGNYGAVIVDPGTPTKTTDAYGSYAFDGWYIDAAFATPLDGTHQYGIVLNLYAKWTLTPASASVTINLNGGSGIGATVSGNYGAVIASPGTPTKASDATGSYAFAGWYIDAAFATPLDGTHQYGFVSNLYAKWTWTAATVVLVVDLDGGTGISSSLSGSYGNSITISGTPTKTDVDGTYAFAGWYVDAGCSTALSTQKFGDVGITTIYAKWTFTAYTVTVHLGDSTSTTVNVSHGESILTAMTNASVSYVSPGANYTFVGWYDAATGGNQVVAGTMFDKDAAITVYARFIDISAEKSAYLGNHQVTIDILLSSVDLTNYETLKSVVQDALDDYESLHTLVQDELSTEKGLLDALMEKIENLELADIYLYYYSSLWDLDTTTVMSGDAQDIEDAIYDYLNELDSDVQALLSTEYALLLELQEELGKRVYITFNANGGTGTQTEQTLYKKITEAIDGCDFTHDTLVFYGWNTSANGSGTWYMEGDDISLSSNQTLYAIWVEEGSNPIDFPPIWGISQGGN